MIKDIIYRKAVPSDALRLSVLCKQVFIETYCNEGINTESANFISKEFAVENTEMNIRNNSVNIILATYKDNLVGVAEAGLNKKCPSGGITAPELNKLYVLEKFCGIGVGYNLLKEIEKLILSNGSDEIWLTVLAINERAVTFYERQGFEWIGNFDFRMEESSHDNKVMFKKLK